ncbi:hypothetical protein KLEB273_gp244 [Bacillus phage vB_BauM_KLEB27-3]|nr:hypothetical protein KLEB273_gp244 [Bacillus phage vB_BauM_KLEB27-3]
MTESEKNFFSLVHSNLTIQSVNNEPGYIFYRDIERMLVNDFHYELCDEDRDKGAHVKFIRPFNDGTGETFVFVFKHPHSTSLNKSLFQLYKMDYRAFKKGIDSIHGIASLMTFMDQKYQLVYETIVKFEHDDTPTNPHELAQLLIEKAYSPAMKAIQSKYGNEF